MKVWYSWMCYLWLAGIGIGLQSVAYGQRESAQPAHSRSAAEVGSSFSFSGFSVQLSYVLNAGHHDFYLGPKLLISDSYLPTAGPFGGQLGYRYHWLESTKLRSFINFDYQITLWKPYDPQDMGTNGLNRIHEIHLAYGIQFQLAEHWSIGNQLGVGTYVEQFIDVQEQETNSFSGFSSLVKGYVCYQF